VARGCGVCAVVFVICCGSEDRIGRDFCPWIARLVVDREAKENALGGSPPFRESADLAPGATWDPRYLQIVRLEVGLRYPRARSRASGIVAVVRA
jgi:hypothetical protein